MVAPKGGKNMNAMESNVSAGYLVAILIPSKRAPPSVTNRPSAPVRRS